MAGLRRTDVIKLISPVETGLVRFNPARHAKPVRSGLHHTRPVQSWHTDAVQPGFDLSDSATSGRVRSKPVQSGFGYTPPVQSGSRHTRLVQSSLGLRDSGGSGLGDSRMPVQTELRSPAGSGTKRPVKRASVDNLSTTEGTPVAPKRRKTALNHTGLNGARKLITSLFGWKVPEAEVGGDTRCHDCHEKRTADVVSTAAKDSLSNSEIRHLATGRNSDVNDLAQQLDLLNFKEKKLSQSSNHLSNGRKQFNMDPKKGMAYLIEHRVVENTPQDVATFMYTAQGLSKTAIGEYLGERHSFNQDALKAFVNLQEFSQTNLVQALRQFLWSFRLPGEAQKIDRMMEQFADRYCQLNPDVFSSTDACYILCFALIMLNTSLHNPNVKDKLTADAFVAMNRGLQADQEMPRQLLLDLYGSIKREPLKIPEDEKEDLMFTFFNPVREGWLYKRGGRCKTWKRRWFILNDGCLYYFQFTTDKEPKGIVPLENIEIRDVSDRSKPNCFELYSPSTDHLKACKTDSLGRVVEGNHKVFRISASTPEEREGWIRTIRSAVSDNPIYDLIYKRRRRSRLPVSEEQRRHLSTDPIITSGAPTSNAVRAFDET